MQDPGFSLFGLLTTVNREAERSPFLDEIDLLSQQSSQDIIYPRPDFTALSRYLKPPSHQRTPSLSDDGSSAPSQDLTQTFAVVHDLAHGGFTHFGPSPASLADFTARIHLVMPKGAVVFLRGYAPPEWLSAVADKLGVAPEFYRRHLEDKPSLCGVSRDCYSSPSLPSSSSRIFQLVIPSLWERSVMISPYEPEDLELDRRRVADSMITHYRQMRKKGARGADSMVSKCLQFSKKTFVLEQTVTVEVGPPGNNWRAVVWMDSGKDLSLGEEGPWSPAPGTKSWETYFVPTIVQQTSSTGQTASLTRQSSMCPGFSRSPCRPMPLPHATSSGVNAQENTLRAGPGIGGPAGEWRAAQNICLLPFQYGSALDKTVASQDALYALSELFQFAASAESQFLNLLDDRIRHELSFIGRENIAGRHHAISLVNLSYIKTQLQSHAKRLVDTVGMLEERELLDWPRIPSQTVTAASRTAERMAALLHTDFVYLARRAEALSRACEQGIGTLANNSILEESRRSADNAMRVERLTLLASTFIPLSFICTIWGMNFVEMGTGSQPFWMWFVTAGPVLVISILVYHIDLVKTLLGKVWRQARRRGKTIRLNSLGQRRNRGQDDLELGPTES